MAITTFGLNDALTVKLWSKSLDNEVLKYTDIGPLIGDDANSVIQRKMETSKGAGDKVTFGLRLQLTGDGFSETDTAEGNGESLTIYSDGVVINELGHVVGVKSENSIDAQRVPFNLRQEARDGLADWYAKRLSISFFNQVCGNTATSGTGFPTSTKYTGLQAATAPTSTRKLTMAGVAQDENLTTYATHSFAATTSLSFIDRAKELAETGSPKIRPVKVGPGNNSQEQDSNNALLDKYIMFLHPYQVTDLRTNVSTGQWLDIQKAAMAGADSTKSPIYTGAYH